MSVRKSSDRPTPRPPNHDSQVREPALAMNPKASRAEDPGAASVRTLGAEEHLIGTAAPGDVTSRKGESLRAVNGNACRSVDVRLK